MSSDIILEELNDPGPAEMNVYRFFKQTAPTLGELEQEILQYLVAAGTARGWFPAVEQVSARFCEHERPESVQAALDALQRRRLLRLEGQAIHSIIGGITHQKTDYKAVSAEGVPFHLWSVLDVLTIAPTLQKPVTVQTTCGVTAAPIELSFGAAGELLQSQPHSVTAFVPGWDGRSALAESLSQTGRFFTSDHELETWQTAHGEPDGMPLTQDTIRFVGMELAGAIAALYVTMSVR